MHVLEVMQMFYCEKNRFCCQRQGMTGCGGDSGSELTRETEFFELLIGILSFGASGTIPFVTIAGVAPEYCETGQTNGFVDIPKCLPFITNITNVSCISIPP